ncbi:MAG: pantoate--beta-alanine ligase [Firmicutes bacterium]|nr:pantoate--beta-alanine ligase [Bacillota bacterium]
MQQVSSIQELRDIVAHVRRAGKRVGFVPTMGYLHEGHLSLVAEAQKRSDFVVVSIFVNPLQFAPTEDLAQYPRDVVRDRGLLQEQGHCDLLFTPSVEEMYPTQMETSVTFPAMSALLCGKSRPTHFGGVATVVTKLFNIVQPNLAFFGQKDGQQLAVIRRLVADLNVPIQIVGVPTIRETDGLAKSSRNIYLGDDERPHATVLYRALTSAKEQIAAGNLSGPELADHMRRIITSDELAQLDYAEVVSMDTLQPIVRLDGHVMLAVAVRFRKARLIDNLQLVLKDGRLTNA